MSSHNKIVLIVNENNVGKRLDVFLTSNIKDITRSKVKYLLTIGNISIINQQKDIIFNPSYKVKLYDKFEVLLIEKESDTLEPQNIPIEILFEDKYLIVINKQAGLVVHPGAGNRDNTLVNGLIYRFNNNLSNFDTSKRPGIVHRLDKNTSGVLVIAKNDHVHNLLSQLFSIHNIERAYRALVWGEPVPKLGNITTFIERHKVNRKKMMVSNKGKIAITHYKTIKTNNILSLLDIHLETGRTHQIRLHLSNLGYPIVGDEVYSTPKYINKIANEETKDLIKSLGRYALHAYKLGFHHPITHEYILIEKEEPKELEYLYKLIFNHNI